jgi:hypothetical protein
MRTDQETISDRLLLLYSVKQANKHGWMDVFKLQKIPFASELKMNEESVKGLNYSFFKYTHGPISKEIYADGGILHQAGLITTLKQPIKLTDKGNEVLSSTVSLLRENNDILGYIRTAAETYAELSFGVLKRKIYDLPIEWGGDTWKVGKIPAFTDMLTKLDAELATVHFRISDNWIDSLWGALQYSERDSQKLRVVRKVAS